MEGNFSGVCYSHRNWLQAVGVEVSELPPAAPKFDILDGGSNNTPNPERSILQTWL